MNTLSAVLRLKAGAHLTPARGVRTAEAALVPLIALAVFHHTALGIVAALGALLVSFCDVEGLARARTYTIGFVTLAGALLFALGRALEQPWWLAVPAIFLATLAAGLVAVYGHGAAAVGLMLNIVFVLALGMGGGPSTAMSSLAGFMIGGVSVLVMGFVPVPLRRRDHSHAAVIDQASPARPRSPSLAPLLAQLTWTSPVFRFAILRAAGAALAGGIGWWLDVSHPQWAVITVILCVRPDPVASLVATAERFVATVLGAVAAGAVIVAVHDSLALALLAVALMVAAFTVHDLSNVLFVFFMTVMTLLLISIPTGGLSLARLRVFEALIGAAIGLIVTSLAPRITGVTTGQGAHAPA
jgi:hypothetical protein